MPPTSCGEALPPERMYSTRVCSKVVRFLILSMMPATPSGFASIVVSCWACSLSSLISKLRTCSSLRPSTWVALRSSGRESLSGPSAAVFAWPLMTTIGFCDQAVTLRHTTIIPTHTIILKFFARISCFLSFYPIAGYSSSRLSVAAWKRR